MYGEISVQLEGVSPPFPALVPGIELLSRFSVECLYPLSDPVSPDKVHSDKMCRLLCIYSGHV